MGPGALHRLHIIRQCFNSYNILNWTDFDSFRDKISPVEKFCPRTYYARNGFRRTKLWTLPAYARQAVKACETTSIVATPTCADGQIDGWMEKEERRVDFGWPSATKACDWGPMTSLSNGANAQGQVMESKIALGWVIWDLKAKVLVLGSRHGQSFVRLVSSHASDFLKR